MKAFVRSIIRRGVRSEMARYEDAYLQVVERMEVLEAELRKAQAVQSERLTSVERRLDAR